MIIKAGQRAPVVGACALLFASMSGTAASAGEIAGKGKSLATVPNPDYTPDDLESSPFVIKGKSPCAYSGLDDEWVAGSSQGLRPTTTFMRRCRTPPTGRSPASRDTPATRSAPDAASQHPHGGLRTCSS